MKSARYMKAFEDFVENVWPVVVQRLGLPEDAEPTDEEFELWDGSQIDYVTDYWPIEEEPVEDEQR
jgi:hypothetical protein